MLEVALFKSQEGHMVAQFRCGSCDAALTMSESCGMFCNTCHEVRISRVKAAAWLLEAMAGLMNRYSILVDPDEDAIEVKPVLPKTLRLVKAA